VCLVDKGSRRDENGARTGAGFGGTCVNVGCVPKKLMYYASSFRESIHGDVAVASGLGFKVPSSAATVDWAALKQRRDQNVANLNEGYEKNWKKAGIDVVVGDAKFVGTNAVLVTMSDGTERTIRASKVLIAVGGVPAMPPLPGVEHAISSDGFFDLAQQPKKVAVVGAGYIAVEMAGILHGLGSQTHLFFRGETVLRRGFDPFIVETLMNELRTHGPALHPDSTPVRVLKAANGTKTLVIRGQDGNEIEHAGFDCVLMAIGRKPSTVGLGLDAAGVKLSSSGHIDVDAYENTSVKGVYALGDVTTTGYELTPVAIAAGRRLADRLFGGEPRARIEYSTIATVVFSHPPIGTIGLTEPQAREEYGDANITVKSARFASMAYSFNNADAKVKTGLKLVLKLPEELVVGLHCIGPASDEMLQGFAVAVRMGATRADFEASVAIHPTISEEFVTFGGWGQKNNGDGVARPYLPPYLRKPPTSDRARTVALLTAGAIAGGVLASLAFGRHASR